MAVDILGLQDYWAAGRSEAAYWKDADQIAAEELAEEKAAAAALELELEQTA
ncbi:MAG TPA: hypothetical protein VLF60_05060 [Candidatus Saccharimonadales bacterium]|nr:hypothetical protein [Candidatus Saccharimonadales bacterium]